MCRFVQPLICLCGTVIDAKTDSPSTYILCGSCALWLGFEEPRFPQGLCFNFSEEHREKIKALREELNIADKRIEETVRTSKEELLAGDIEGGLGEVQDFLRRTPNLRELLRLRFSLLPENIIDLSGRLTRGELVDSAEIKKVNRG